MWSRRKWAVRFGFWTLIALGAAANAHALTINLTYDPSVAADFGANTTSMTNAMTYVAQTYENLYSNPVTLNITVAGSPGTSILGGSVTNLAGYYSYSQIRNAMVADAANNPSDATKATSVANLPLSDPSGGHSYAAATAEAKALGLPGTLTGSDGTATFGSGFNYTFDPNNRTVAGAIDFIGVAEHEISEVMGRIPGLGANFGDGGPDYLPYDLFRYNQSSTTRNMTNGNNIWFSYDGGATDLLAYNFPNGNGSDPQDWAGATNDSYNAFGTTGVKNDISAVDKAAMDVLGYDLAGPSFSWAVNATGQWDSPSNWGGTIPGAADTAKFAGSSYAAQPLLSNTAAVGGIWVLGSGSVAIGGSALTLVGTNTINGNSSTGIEVDAGAGALTINVPLVLVNDQQWINNSSNALTISGSVTGNGSLTTSGSGLFSFGGNVTLAGTLTVSSGSLNQVGGLFSAPVEIVGVSGTGNFTQSNGTNSVSGGIVLGQTASSAGIYNLNGGLLSVSGLTQGAGSAVFNFSGGTFQAASSFSTSVPIVLSTAGSAGVFDTNGNTLSVAGGISGSGSLTKMGSGMLVLNGVNTYSGSTTVAGGTLALLSGNNSSSFTANNGGTLLFNGSSVNLGFASVRAASGGYIQYQNSNITGGFLVGPGAHTVVSNSTDSFTATTINTSVSLQQNGATALMNVTNRGQIVNNAPLTWNGGVNDGGSRLMVNNSTTVSDLNNAGVIVISNSGILNNHLTDFTSYGGGRITVNSGGTLNADSQSEGVALDLQDSLLINNGTVTGTTNVNYGATLQGSGTFGPINVFNGGTLAISLTASPLLSGLAVSSGNITGSGQSVSPATVANATITTPNLSDRLTLSGDLSGLGPITKNGRGLLILSGDNTYTGGTTVIDGTLVLASPTAVEDGTSLTVGTNAASLFAATSGGPLIASAAVSSVPEPGMLVQLVAGLIAGYGVWRRGKR